MSQRTLVLLKPDTVRRGLVGDVLSRFEAKGLTIVALELRTIDAALADRLLRQVGVDEPGTLAAMIVSLIVGTALRRQSGYYAEQVEARLLTAAIRDLLAAHLLGPATVAATVLRGRITARNGVTVPIGAVRDGKVAN